MGKHEAWWKNAIRMMGKINAYLEKGFRVFDEHGEQVEHKFFIKDNQILRPHQSSEHKGDKVFTIIFENDPEYDHGLHTTIDKFNKRFESWKIVDPKHMKGLV